MRYTDVPEVAKVVLSNYYNGSIEKALCTIYPEEQWPKRPPTRDWTTLDKQRQFLEQVAKDMNIVTIDGWSKVTVKDVKQRGGAALVNYYNGSLTALLRSVYPQHNWEATKFNRMPRHYWPIPENQQQFMRSIASKYNIATQDDWKKITSEVILQEGGASLLTMHGGSITKGMASLQSLHPYSIEGTISRPSMGTTKTSR